MLEEIKADDSLKRIPVVDPDDLQEARKTCSGPTNLHANCYITKPVDFNRFMEVVKSIEDFWLTVVRLPDDK